MTVVAIIVVRGVAQSNIEVNDGSGEQALRLAEGGTHSYLNDLVASPDPDADDTPLIEGSIGLGLSIARTLARDMGGDVWYENEDGLTVFTIELPLTERTRGDERQAETKLA